MCALRRTVWVAFFCSDETVWHSDVLRDARSTVDILIFNSLALTCYWLKYVIFLDRDPEWARIV